MDVPLPNAETVWVKTSAFPEPVPDRRVKRPRWAAARPLIVLVAFYLLMVAPMVALQAKGTPEYMDELEYHLPIIRTIVEQWPAVDIVRYESATSPGFHLLMAAVWRATDAPQAMKWLNACFGLGLLLAMFLTAARFVPAWGALALVLPLLFNQYILGAAVWLTTDNAALLCVVLALGGSIMVRAGGARLLRCGVYAGLAVCVRQLHVWLAAPIGLAGLVASPLVVLVPRMLRPAPQGASAARSSWLMLGAGLLAAAIPFLTLAYFSWIWGWRLMPICSGWVQLHALGPNPASPAFALALVAVLGLFFLPFCAAELLRLRLSDRAAWSVLLIGALVAAIPETSYVWKSRSYGFLWRIVERVPDVAERSPVIMLLAPLGALGLLLMHRAAAQAGHAARSLVLQLSLLGWLCAQTFNSMAWQRYFEPVLLLGLAWLAALTVRRSPEPEGPRAPLAKLWPWAGPLLLGLLQLALSLVSMYREAISSAMRG